jgi:large subunit ribosomal protein L4
MINAPKYSATGVPSKDAFVLPTDLFDGTVNEAVLHQAVKTYLGNQRQGTHKVKTRAEVSGGNQKPWKQKGTGRARQGTTRAPHWRGGGVVFGPSPRDYRTDIPKKVRQLARRSGFNAKAREGNLHVIEALSFEAPKTSRMLELVEKLGLAGKRVLVLTAGAKPNVYLSARNVQRLEVLPFAEATAYDLLLAEALVVEADALSTKEGA